MCHSESPLDSSSGLFALPSGRLLLQIVEQFFGRVLWGLRRFLRASDGIVRKAVFGAGPVVVKADVAPQMWRQSSLAGRIGDDLRGLIRPVDAAQDVVSFGAGDQQAPVHF